MESVACWLCQDFVSICAAIRQRDIKVNWNACRSTQHQLASWLSRVEHLKLNLKLERCCTGVAAAARGPCHARADGRVSKIFNWICHWAAAIVWAMVGVWRLGLGLYCCYSLCNGIMYSISESLLSASSMGCMPPPVLANELVRRAISMARNAGRLRGNLPFWNGDKRWHIKIRHG